MGISSRTTRKQRALLTLILAISLLVPTTAIAQGPSPAPAENELAPEGQVGIKIAPTRFDEQLTPGQAKDGFIEVYNVSRVPVTVTPTVENARMTGSDGSLEFFIGENPFKLHNFVQLDKTPFVLGVGEARRVPFRIAIPAGVYPGGYFGAILFQVAGEVNVQDGSTVGQAGRVGTLLTLEVAGDTDRRGRISRFEVASGLFATNKQFRAAYANTGNTVDRPLGVAIKPSGTLRIKNIFGRTVASRDVTGELTYPGAERQFSMAASKPLWFGRYVAELTLTAGTDGPVSRAQATFWTFSPVALLAWLLLVITGVLLVRQLRLRRSAKPRLDQSVSLLDEVAKTESAATDHRSDPSNNEVASDEPSRDA